MIVTVIGKKHLHFVNEKDNKEVEVCTIFGTHKNPYDDNITKYEGQGCSQVNVPLDHFNKIKVGKKYAMDFDKKGKLLEITEL